MFPSPKINRANSSKEDGKHSSANLYFSRRSRGDAKVYVNEKLVQLRHKRNDLSRMRGGEWEKFMSPVTFLPLARKPLSRNFGSPIRLCKSNARPLHVSVFKKLNSIRMDVFLMSIFSHYFDGWVLSRSIRQKSTSGKSTSYCVD
jgi:hypothetical protein